MSCVGQRGKPGKNPHSGPTHSSWRKVVRGLQRAWSPPSGKAKKARGKETDILLHISEGADIVLQTPPARRASNTLPSVCELADWSSAASCHWSSTINLINI